MGAITMTKRYDESRFKFLESSFLNKLQTKNSILLIVSVEVIL